MDWLERIPAAVVRAHLSMLDRLSAEESMERATVACVGNVRPRPSAVRQQWAAWRRAAAPRRRAGKATPAGLAAAGIGLKVVNGG